MIPTRIAPSVAPTSGTRSSRKITTASDQRLAERARDVVAHGVGDPVEQAPEPGAALRPLAIRDPVEPAAAGAEHEQAQHEDRDAREDGVHEPEADVGEDPSGVADAPGQRARLLLQLGR